MYAHVPRYDDEHNPLISLSQYGIMNYRWIIDIHIVIVFIVFDSLMNTHTPDHFNYNQTYICIWSCGLMPDSSSKRHGTRCCCF